MIGPQVCFFGFGSSHGDDQLGWIVAEMLRRDKPPGLKIVVCRTPIDLVHRLEDDEVIAEAERWIFCDACQGAGRPGTIHRFRWPAVRNQMVRWYPHSHGWGLVPVLELLAQLRRLRACVAIYAVEIASVGSEQPLSAVVREAVPQLVDRIRREVLRA